jgi:hypothetical protein
VKKRSDEERASRGRGRPRGRRATVPNSAIIYKSPSRREKKEPEGIISAFRSLSRGLLTGTVRAAHPRLGRRRLPPQPKDRILGFAGGGFSSSAAGAILQSFGRARDVRSWLRPLILEPLRECRRDPVPKPWERSEPLYIPALPWQACRGGKGDPDLA